MSNAVVRNEVFAPGAAGRVSVFSKPLQCLDVVRFRYEAGFCEEWDRHRHCEIIHVLSGEAVFTVDGKRFRATPGSTVFIKSNAAHGAKVSRAAGVEGIFMDFEPGPSWAADVQQIDIEALLSANGKTSERIREVVGWCLSENTWMRWGAQETADSLLTILLVECVRAASSPEEAGMGHTVPEEAGMGHTVEMDGSPNECVNRISDACVRYIKYHYSEPLSLPDVADAIFVSSFHLSHIFSQTMGTTFSEYLNDLRIRRAATLLRETDLLIKEVAYRVGYPDAAYFSRAFRKRFTQPPVVYRKAVEENPGQEIYAFSQLGFDT